MITRACNNCGSSEWSTRTDGCAHAHQAKGATAAAVNGARAHVQCAKGIR